MLGLGGDTVQQQRSTGDRFVVFVGVGEPHEECPPVVDERHHACHQSAALQWKPGRRLVEENRGALERTLRLVEAVTRES